ncbi:DUF2922 domain-containing protein [Domibacillus enclensis]|uniref:DUF2922 domain-containing protein n=1 Tax=Domibacillus enclensis TaxID=1017273 RepID=A0A1N7C143_9BACI|nr:DUF2922 domain-containing protein [Domibacillus enclensis]OXS74192.1 hypothetical protein B1B05_17105 [Domibacillus enclensis]SIR57285.1 Protein of unknown function [Domibacillus enclensis]
MAKVLELNFTATGGETKLMIRNPKEPVDPVQVKAAMEQIIAADVFFSTKGYLTGVIDARIVERNTQDIVL